MRDLQFAFCNFTIRDLRFPVRLRAAPSATSSLAASTCARAARAPHAGRRWMASLISTAAFIHATRIAT